MRVVETEWWILALPEEWRAERDEETVIISDEDGVGEIAITTLCKQDGESVTREELLDYSADVAGQHGHGQEATIGEVSGFYYCYRDGDEAVREWYLRHGSLLLLVTYSCAVDNAGMDDAAVDDILATLSIDTDSGEHEA